jgi:hypothetical protein
MGTNRNPSPDHGTAKTKTGVSSPSVNDDINPSVSQFESFGNEDKQTRKFNLTQKISSLTSYDDPFKNIYRSEWRANASSDVEAIVKETNPTSGPAVAKNESVLTMVQDPKSENSEQGQVTYINGRFQNVTLQRVLALRKVQHAIQFAPNPSAVGADSTTFSEDDLTALTMEELQALQRRKRDIGKEIQPLSVVKVSIQAERSKKRLEPRDYQMELYDRARRENTIAVLGTGTGKTLIACLLIKDILVQERFNRVAGKKVGFLRREITDE